MEKEIWYDIKGYDRYKISDKGRVRDLNREDFVEPILVDNRHCYVSLYNNSNKLKKEKLSVLVFKNILGVNKSTYYVLYKDNNPYNCSINNIYEIHYSHRSRKRLDRKDVEKIYLATKNMTVKEVAGLYDLPASTIYSIINKKSYKDITDYIDLVEAMKNGYIPELLKF